MNVLGNLSSKLLRLRRRDGMHQVEIFNGWSDDVVGAQFHVECEMRQALLLAINKRVIDLEDSILFLNCDW